MTKLLKTLGAGILIALCASGSQIPVNPDSVIIQDFERKVADYVQLRKRAESSLPPIKATPSQNTIEHHEEELARAVAEARNGAQPGDIFTPPIAMEMQRLIGIAMAQARDRNRIRKSLRSGEPVGLRLKVNQRYPAQVPRQSTPPSLLLNLPPLPPELEYRLAGGDLILLDSKANLVVDLVKIELP